MSFIFGANSVQTLDPIFATDEIFRQDPATNKLNLILGVYQDETGNSPVLESVKAAEAYLISNEGSKAYLPVDGDRFFIEASEHLLFDDVRSSKNFSSLQTPGSTGALRIAAEIIKRNSPSCRIWIGTPAYSNHAPLFEVAGLEVVYNRYFDEKSGVLLFEEMLTDLSEAAPGDVVLLHGCCHNPTGSDLTIEQWMRLAEFITERSLVPLIDAAYLGFVQDIRGDTKGMKAIITNCAETIVAVSMSKNFALYRERLGLLTFFSANQSQCQSALKQAKACARVLYTSPPSHGAQIVATILADPDLASQWEAELDAMRLKLLEVRLQLSSGLRERGVSETLIPSLEVNRGMFSLSRLTEKQVHDLRTIHHVYLLPNGRISFGGLKRSDVTWVCDAIRHVTSQ